MARPRSNKTQDLPTGLWYRKDRDIYVLNRVDGSVITLCKDKPRAVRLTLQYNAAYRNGPLLGHDIPRTASKLDARKFEKLGGILPGIFEQIVNQKRWSKNYIRQQSNEFVYIKNFFNSLTGSAITIEHINDFLSQRSEGRSNQQYNNTLSLLQLTFAYLVNDSYIDENVSIRKIRRTVKSKSSDEVVRLTFDDFAAIHQLAGSKGLPYIQVAMELALQTSHAVLEVTRIKYSDITDHIKLKRQKNKKARASAVAIPINDELERIVKFSKQDGIASPYVVHCLRRTRHKLNHQLEDPTQLVPERVSAEFGVLRDELGLYSDITDRRARPGFHHIRALSIHWQEEHGYHATARAAHSKRETTEVYKKGHVHWNEVPDVVVKWKNQRSSI